MMQNSEENDEPPSRVTGTTPSAPSSSPALHSGNGNENGSRRAKSKNGILRRRTPPFFYWFRSLIKGKSAPQDSSATLREALEEYIEECKEDTAQNGDTITSISAHEQALISNVLHLRDLSVFDVMIPRADIVAVDINISQEDLLALLADKQFSRFPVYEDSLDNVTGTIHIKDIISLLARGEPINIAGLVREVPIVSPSMHVLDLLLMMKQMRKHMALVVDEFGGIDGLATIGDVIEAIVGVVEDEHEQNQQPQLIENPQDNSMVADGRFDIDEFENRYGQFLTEEEREDIDTLGGLLCTLTGRVPARGEILSHSSGIVFEVIEADPRRVNKILIKNIPFSEQN